MFVLNETYREKENNENFMKNNNNNYVEQEHAVYLLKEGIQFKNI